MPFKRKAEKKVQPTIEVPSKFGSHASMIVAETLKGEPWFALRDEKGVYETTLDRLDTGLADPRRYDSNRVIETPNTRAVVK